MSCAALLAQALGASEQQVVMAAGLAGGIGLSGGGCGALGAAVWIFGMKKLQGGARKIAYKDPGTLKVIDEFARCTGGELKCSRIVGRSFAGIRDHAEHLCQGGCSRILETLADRPYDGCPDPG